MNRRKAFKKLLLFLAFAFLLSGCPTTSMKYTVKDVPVYGETKADKGLIYILRSSWRASFLEIEMFMNEKPVGVTKGGTYFFCYLEPGDYIMKAKAGKNVQELTLEIEKGKVYYINWGMYLTQVTTIYSVSYGAGLMNSVTCCFL